MQCGSIRQMDLLWNRKSKVGLVDAVASLCGGAPVVCPPIAIRGRRYIDGGMVSPTNTGAAKGYDLVVVVEMRRAEIGPAAKRFQLARARTRCPAQRWSTSAANRTRSPAFEAFRLNPMDPSGRAR
jgi:NTE family protein